MIFIISRNTRKTFHRYHLRAPDYQSEYQDVQVKKTIFNAAIIKFYALRSLLDIEIGIGFFQCYDNQNAASGHLKF